MKRRHGINTSHTKHLPQNQQQQNQSQSQQGQSQQQTQQPANQHQVIQTEPTEDPLQTESSSVQVIQTVPHASASQPIVVQAIPTTAIQTFQTESSSTVQGPGFRERNTSYFNAMPATLQNFLPPNLPYNFYNIPNVSEADLIQHR